MQFDSARLITQIGSWTCTPVIMEVSYASAGLQMANMFLQEAKTI
jgi:hypothetical protein